MLWRRGRPYSQDLRERVFAAADDGAQVCETAEMLHVSVSYVSKVLERRRTTGETWARPQGGGMRPKLAGLYDAIRDHVASRPDGRSRNCGHGCGRPIRSRRVSGWFGAPWPCSA